MNHNIFHVSLFQNKTALQRSNEVMKISIKKTGALFLLSLLIGVIVFSANGQSKKELINKRKKLIKEIKETQALLKDIRKNKASTLDEYQTLKAGIDKQTELISTIKSEIKETELNITHTQDTIELYKANLKRFQGDYANMMRHAYRHRNANKRALFVLSAVSFNDAMRRWQYFKRYDQQRKKQIQLVGQTQKKLNKKIVNLQKTHDNKKTLLVENETQQEGLKQNLAKQKKLLTQLKSKESSTVSNLENKRVDKALLTDEIDRTIRTEMGNSQANSRNRKKGAPRKLSPIDAKKATSFRKAKGKMPRPVKGVITGRYGTYNHPTLKRVTIKNNGIDIKTYSNSAVKAIYAGQVVNVFTIPGSKKAVMVRHGNYYSVYSNLSSVKVKKGHKIKQSQTLGIVGVNAKTNQPELHLEIWKNDQHLNPTRWIK